ncbi:MAG: uracil-DNA glycosylase [Thermomicrobiales bacterium]
MTPTASRFDSLAARATACRACPAMEGQIRVLSRRNGPVDAEIMLVGEAPGRLGAGQSGVPFSGDESGRRLDQLVAAAGLSRSEVFITNAVLCNPLDDRGRNRPPRQAEMTNCRTWLEEQIDVINPTLVIALGAVALRNLDRIEQHGRVVKDSASEPIPWYGRYLAAAYHPGARAAIHRPFPDQLDDFRRLGGWIRANSRY